MHRKLPIQRLASLLVGIAVAAHAPPVHSADESDPYASSKQLLAEEGWVVAWDVQHRIQRGDGARLARLRVFPDGRVLAVQGAREPVATAHLKPSEVAALVDWLIKDQQAQLRAEQEITLPSGKIARATLDPLRQALWNQQADRVAIRRDGKIYDLLAFIPEQPGTVDSLSPKVHDRLQRLTALVIAEGPEKLKLRLALANEQLQKRFPDTPLTLDETALQHAGFDSDGTRALFLAFGAGGPGIGFPRGEMVIRVPVRGAPYVDSAAYWSDDNNGSRWGRKTEK